MKQLTDDELVEQYRNGNEKAFDSLLDRYAKPLYNFIFRMLRNEAESEDILQEVFIRVIKNIGRYEMKGKFKSWIFTIANRLVMSEFRHRSKRHFLSLDRKLTRDGSGLTLIDVIADEKYLPDVEAERKELHKKLDEVIELLSFPQKQVVMMRQFSGFTFKEIAKILGCPLNTVLGRMHYALKNLRRELAGFYQ